MYCLHSAASPHLNRHPSPQHQHHHHHVDCHPPIAHHHHQHQIYHSSDRPAKIIEQNTNSHIWIVKKPQFFLKHKDSLATSLDCSPGVKTKCNQLGRNHNHRRRLLQSQEDGSTKPNHRLLAITSVSPNS